MGRDLDRMIRRKYSCSNAWRGIMETMKLTKQGVGVAIGDGRQTNFWSHKWLDGKKLFEWANGVVPEDHHHKRVCDYWRPNIGWDWTQFSQFLPFAVLQRIASFKLVTEELGDNSVWIADKSGTFTIKSAMKIIRAIDSITKANWRWIWKIRIPQRMKLFLWLILYLKVLSNAERFQRKMISTPQCELCLGEMEDLEHVLRSCPNA